MIASYPTCRYGHRVPYRQERCRYRHVPGPHDPARQAWLLRRSLPLSDAVDVEALVDSTLTYGENRAIVEPYASG